MRNHKFLLGTAAFLLLFALALASQATGAGPLPGDLPISHLIQAILPPNSALFGLSVWLGKLVTYLPLIAIAVALLTRKWGAALLLAVTGLVVVYYLEDQLKLWYPRARPSNNLINVYQALKSNSFPSGTAFRTMTVLGTGWLFCLQAWPGNLAVRGLMTACVLLLWLTGLMRVWLGVHWASDVLGGWLFGGAWVLLTWWLYQMTSQRFTHGNGERKIVARSKNYAAFSSVFRYCQQYVLRQSRSLWRV